MNGAMFLPEYEHECGETRRTLERVPEDKFDWKPHEKSFTLRELAGHLANIPRWVPITLQQDVFELDPDWKNPEPTSVADLLEEFDAGVAEAKEIIADATGDQLMSDWSMKQGDEVILSMPKAAVLRSFIFNHQVHHRAQLGVYLRLLDVPVPGPYGPSADEQM